MHLDGGIEKQIQRSVDGPFGGVFHWHHADIGLPCLNGTKHLIKGRTRQRMDRMTVELHGSLLGKRPFWTQIGHGQPFFQASAHRNDFCPDGPHTSFSKGTVAIELLQRRMTWASRSGLSTALSA